MRMFIQDDEGQLIATFIDGELYSNGFFSKEVFGFQLFVLLTKMMAIPSASGIGISDIITRPTEGDSDFGSPSIPDAPTF
jgi:hypothetical protein